MGVGAETHHDSSGSSNTSDHGETGFPPYDQSYQQISRMADEFEEEFKQFNTEAEFGGRQTGDDSEGGGGADSSDPRLIDISSTQALVAGEGCDGGEVKGHEWPAERGRGSDDVEEGELSDSGSEQHSAVTEGRQVGVFYGYCLTTVLVQVLVLVDFSVLIYCVRTLVFTINS